MKGAIQSGKCYNIVDVQLGNDIKIIVITEFAVCNELKLSKV